MEVGGPCVGLVLAVVMLKWFVDNLDSKLQVSYLTVRRLMLHKFYIQLCKPSFPLAPAVLNRVSSPPNVGSLPIVIDLVMCTGTEDQLVDCSRAPVVEGCSHSMDTGVNCTTPNRGEYDCV